MPQLKHTFDAGATGAIRITLGEECMFFGRLFSLVVVITAIVGVFVEIPIVSEWAFWFMVGLTYCGWA